MLSGATIRIVMTFHLNIPHPLPTLRLLHSPLTNYASTSLFVLGSPSSTIHHHVTVIAIGQHQCLQVTYTLVRKLGIVMVWDSDAPRAFQHDSPPVTLPE